MKSDIICILHEDPTKLLHIDTLQMKCTRIFFTISSTGAIILIPACIYVSTQGFYTIASFLLSQRESNKLTPYSPKKGTFEDLLHNCLQERRMKKVFEM